MAGDRNRFRPGLCAYTGEDAGIDDDEVRRDGWLQEYERKHCENERPHGPKVYPGSFRSGAR